MAIQGTVINHRSITGNDEVIVFFLVFHGCSLLAFDVLHCYIVFTIVLTTDLHIYERYSRTTPMAAVTNMMFF